jgi:hypothetical protein
VLPVTSLPDFIEILRRLTDEPDYYQRISMLQAKEASSWGRLDGHAGERIIALLEGLASTRIGGRRI